MILKERKKVSLIASLILFITLSFVYGLNLLKSKEIDYREIEKESRNNTNIEENASIQITKTYEINGRVINQEYRKPIPYFQLIMIYRDNVKEVTCDRYGRFTIAGLKPGQYSIHSRRKYFLYKPYSFVLRNSNINDITFRVYPNEPIVEIEPYLQFIYGKEKPVVKIEVFRYAELEFNLYKLNPLECFMKWNNPEDFSNIDISALKELDRWTKGLHHSIPFDIIHTYEHPEIDEPGLYLLAISAGNKLYKSIISLTDMIPAVNNQGTSITVTLLNDQNETGKEQTFLARAIQNNEVINEKKMSDLTFKTVMLARVPIVIVLVNNITAYRLMITPDNLKSGGLHK